MDGNRRAVLVTAAILTLALGAGCGTGSGPDGADPGTPPTATTSTSPSDQPVPADDPLGGRPPLWPFSTPAEVAQWRERGPGHSPWHLDAEATALFFTTNYLGFTDINQVIDTEIGPSEAKVTVGYRGDLPRAAPAAVLHLLRYGEGEDAPWEVVGTIDDTLTITSPEPGALVTSPVEVAGRITGVDESIHLQVRAPDQTEPVGDSCCLPAGGEDTPWSTTVPVTDAGEATLTLVAATGGHAADVERLAVTGIRLAD